MSEHEQRRQVWELEWKLAKGEGTPEEQQEWARKLMELRPVH